MLVSYIPLARRRGACVNYAALGTRLPPRLHTSGLSPRSNKLLCIAVLFGTRTAQAASSPPSPRAAANQNKPWAATEEGATAEVEAEADDEGTARGVEEDGEDAATACPTRGPRRSDEGGGATRATTKISSACRKVYH